jgi:hypothetical protein
MLLLSYLLLNYVSEQNQISYRSFPLPNDLTKNPLKTVLAARTEATMALSRGRRIIKDITNIIADAKTARGIQYITILEGPFTPDSIPFKYRL